VKKIIHLFLGTVTACGIKLPYYHLEVEQMHKSLNLYFKDIHTNFGLSDNTVTCKRCVKLLNKCK